MSSNTINLLAEYSEPKPTNMPLPMDVLKERLSYDPETGGMTWLKRRRGDRATHDGSKVVIDGISYLTHRVAWALMTGQDPGGFGVLFDDGDKTNRAFSNLILRVPAYTNWFSLNCFAGEATQSTPCLPDTISHNGVTYGTAPLFSL